VRNAAIDAQRSARRRDRREQTVAGQSRQSRPWFESRPDDAIDAAAAEAALAGIAPDQREVILLRLWGGLTLRETAEVLGDPISTLFARYRAGLTAVRHAMENPCEMSRQTTTP